MGKKSAANVIAAIEASKEPPLGRFIFGLGIRHVGEHVGDVLAQAFGSVDVLRYATVEQLNAVHEIGLTTAESVVEYFGEKETDALLAKFAAAGREAARERGGAGVGSSSRGSRSCLPALWSCRARRRRRW